jgi:mannose-1-phosphate guanylyltransferase
MVVLSADHAISPKKDFINAVNYAIKLAGSLDTLIVFGIPPSRPDTGYGYIQLDKRLDKSGLLESYKVKRFVEKPTLKKAEQYLSSKKYLWNSGMFVWKASVILEEFKQYMPSMYEGVIKAGKHGFNQKTINSFYQACEKQSIDYGIMERSRRVAAVKGLFTWDDLGSWESLSRVLSQNRKQTTVSGKRVFEKDCLRAIITNNSDMTVAAIGLKDTTVVAVDDAVLVIARDKLPELRKYLAEMKNNSNFPRKLF